jgi:hypothetical protein
VTFVGETFLEIVTGAGEPVVHETWLLQMGEHGFTFVTPAGVTHELGWDGTPAQFLDRAKELEPEAFRIYRMQTVIISTRDELASLLPLWLEIRDTESPVGPIRHRAFDLGCINMEEQYYPATVIGEYWVSINGEPWVVVDNDGSGLVVFCGGADYLPDNFQQEWASWSFCETASRVSGYDRYILGLLTNDIVATYESQDEGPKVVTTHLASTPVQELQSWIETGDLLRQLKETWEPEPDGCDDFITEGFRALARSAGTSIDLRGALPDEDDLGVGRTATSEWTFSCSLDPQVITEALGESTPAAIARYDALVRT